MTRIYATREPAPRSRGTSSPPRAQRGGTSAYDGCGPGHDPRQLLARELAGAIQPPPIAKDVAATAQQPPGGRANTAAGGLPAPTAAGGGGGSPPAAASPWPAWLQRCGIGSSCPCQPHDKITAVQRDLQRATLGGGSPLSGQTRTRMERAFTSDFSAVRLHTGPAAQAVASTLHAQAVTAGTDILFGSGADRPNSPGGERLLAHELAHVVQQAHGLPRAALDGGAADPLEQAADRAAGHASPAAEHEANYAATAAIQGAPVPALTRQPATVARQDLDAGTPADAGVPNQERLLGLDRLMSQIAVQTYENIGTRAELDALPAASSEERIAVEQALEAGRDSLIQLLESRIALLDEEISSLQDRIGPNPISTPENPELEALGHELVRREAERREHEQQLRPLLRRQRRREIQSIDAELAEIDEELAMLPSECDPSDPKAELLAARRVELEERKRHLARALSSTATEYEQWDERWGAKRYGPSSACTNIKEAGCGPTSLAIVLNYLYQDDPESLAATGQLEIVTPLETAKYAGTHGRVCNSGTAGDTMVTQVDTGFPGFRGERITLEQATSLLRGGNLVIFLCKNCTGTTRSGATSHYGGHFMVLSDVDASGQTYSVLDPGRSESKDIETISRTELETHTKGFWDITRK